MPKELKVAKKGEKPKIQIAKAEMTLTGFQHKAKILRKKARLEARAIRGKRTEQIEVHSKSARSRSDKKSSIK